MLQKKVLVTGGSGFIGSHIVDNLKKKKFKVFVLDKVNPKRKDIIFVKNKNFNFNFLLKITKGIDFVYHLAGVSDINKVKDQPVKTINDNIIFTTTLLEACRLNKVKKFLFASSIYTYGNEGNLYTTSKISSELIVKNYKLLFDLDYTIMRFSSIFGLRNRKVDVISIFANKAKKNKKIIVEGNGLQTRNFIDVKRAAKIAVDLMIKKFDNKIIAIASEKDIKIIELAKKIIRILDSKSKIKIKKKLKRQDDFDFEKISKKIGKPFYPFIKKLSLDKDLKNFLISESAV